MEILQFGRGGGGGGEGDIRLKSHAKWRLWIIQAACRGEGSGLYACLVGVGGHLFSGSSTPEQETGSSALTLSAELPPSPYISLKWQQRRCWGPRGLRNQRALPELTKLVPSLSLPALASLVKTTSPIKRAEYGAV
ncbi:hypothetical protein EYF80_004468 [Liparis tanakae]|uniref:Uncharacterized protein n=1 Tax=Liparis tanakae TaxID=230148 RepID=A0A4Z2J5I3_9TELE|nr:hypothetical protein EYF80_004468 [Liparis tanakae]